MLWQHFSQLNSLWWWAVMVLLMNPGDALQSVGGLAIAVLALAVCTESGKTLKRFWPRHFFAAFCAVHLALLGGLATL
ncbi:TraX family protein [Klebsiella sp. WOUb02]|uniref:TraX family protein n=1 Tax=Klebsiella sp. WOUb02 TaxID=3161071 RepID=UPI003CF13C3B